MPGKDANELVYFAYKIKCKRQRRTLRADPCALSFAFPILTQ